MAHWTCDELSLLIDFSIKTFDIEKIYAVNVLIKETWSKQMFADFITILCTAPYVDGV